jgi:uncharacterized SAM-binding protein YcdF (DUF218 family)
MVRKLIFRAVAGFILLLVPVVLTAYFYPEKFLCVDSGKNVPADVIVVLGGGGHEQRAERAAELFRQRAAPRILITGAGDDEINRLILLQQGVPAGAIEVEGDSTTTRENAEFTLRRLRAENVRRVVLVTSWYHARRALKTFEHYAPGLEFYSRPSYAAFDRADWARHGSGRRMRLEFLKLPGYWLRYGINPF